MKKMWKKTMGIFCAVGLSAMCLAGCGKDTAGSPEISTQEIQQNNVADGAQANNNAADDKAQADNNTADDEVQANRENDAPLEQGADNNVADGGEFLEGARLQGTVVEFSETGFTLSPATTEEDGKVLAETAPGSESDENNVQITYTDNTVFQIINYSKDSLSELSREDTDKESVKKQSSVAVFGSCQDAYHWTADKILIIRFQ
ncbi:hypothetical protein [Sporofaciens musculi]|uniref:hypothetical protein n=1 Tax=Sporofaciens musculi TaxID=2681861 RepID=UPI0025700566|nr:hypothetical protein [Sporofaciens musculi]